MRALSIGWSIFVDLIALFVVFAMFIVAKSTFETIVISALTLIYLSVNNATVTLARATAAQYLASRSQFIDVAALLKHSGVDDLRASLKDETEEFEKSNAKYWINAVFSSLIFLVAMFNLVTAVLRG